MLTTRRYFAFILAALMIFCMTMAQPASAFDSITTSPMLNERYISNILNSGIRYYAFVYTEDPGFNWYRDNLIGLNTCQEGYLYVKDYVTGDIWKVLENQ